MEHDNNNNNPYEVRQCKELGRYLVAARDIEPREIIIQEDPLVSGPTDRGPKDIPVCLGCCCVMFDEPTKRCSTCHWPVCCDACEKLPLHASNECQIFHKNRVLYPPPYGWPNLSKSIVILRCLLLKTKNPCKWELLMNMSDNKEIRQGKPSCINSDKKILENFAKFMPAHDDDDHDDGDGSSSSNGGGGICCGKLVGSKSASVNDAEKKKKGFLQEEVIRISGIIDTNAHAFPLSINGRSTFVCNLYSKTSLLAHSCKPVASWSPPADKSLSSLTLTIRANVPIAKGTMISVAYDDGQLLVCTLKRLVPNEINGMFVCHCERCLDPTELGTYIGAVKCPSCPKGYLLPIDPVDLFSSWKCDNGGGGETKKRQRNNNNNNKNDDHEHVVETGESGTNNNNIITAGVVAGELVPSISLNVDDNDDANCDCKANSKTATAAGTTDDDDEEEDDDDDERKQGSGNCSEILDDESVVEIIEEAESLCGYTRLHLGPAADPPQSSEEKAQQEERLSLLQEFEREYSGVILHPSHYILQEVNVRILRGTYGTGLSSLSDSDLIQYLERCERLLEIANVLTPGFCEYRAFLQFHFSQGLLSLERRKGERMEKQQQQQQQRNNNKGTIGKEETCRGGEKEDDVGGGGGASAGAGEATKLKQESTDDVTASPDDDDDDDNLNSNHDDGDDDVFSRKRRKEKNCHAKYDDSEKNLELLMEMLTFLLVFFREISSEHKLLEPIADTLEDTEAELGKFKRITGDVHSTTEDTAGVVDSLNIIK